MIKVTINKVISAKFDAMKWTCDDPLIAQVLDGTFIRAELSVGDEYRISAVNSEVTGLDAVALDAMVHVGEVVVVNNEPAPLPEEQAGVVI